MHVPFCVCLSMSWPEDICFGYNSQIDFCYFFLRELSQLQLHGHILVRVGMRGWEKRVSKLNWQTLISRILQMGSNSLLQRAVQVFQGGLMLIPMVTLAILIFQGGG